MRVAFYAPMKSPRHPHPSGDRELAKLLLRALELGGHEVQLASEFRSYEGAGNSAEQQAIRQQAEAEAAKLLESYRDNTLPKPALWFTYHLYHKAPDWIGPRICDALEIPYVIAEASYAGKQTGGPWDLGLDSSKRAIAAAAAVISFNSVDDAGVLPLLREDAPIRTIAPFIDTVPYARAASQRHRHRIDLAARFDIDASVPWLICVAMMRPGDKLRSYQLLGSSLAGLQDRDWQLIVIGDGSARAQTTTALAAIAERVRYLGLQDSEALPGIYAACDLYVWPAIGEAFGMAFVEAQAAGLAVVAGDSGGVSNVVHAPECGVLVESGRSSVFAEAVASALDEPTARQQLAAAAQQCIRRYHGLEAGAAALNQIIEEVTACRC